MSSHEPELELDAPTLKVGDDVTLHKIEEIPVFDEPETDIPQKIEPQEQPEPETEPEPEPVNSADNAIAAATKTGPGPEPLFLEVGGYRYKARGKIPAGVKAKLFRMFSKVSTKTADGTQAAFASADQINETALKLVVEGPHREALKARLYGDGVPDNEIIEDDEIMSALMDLFSKAGAASTPKS